MPPTRGKKRSSRDTQKQNVNDPREGATRVVTVASGHQKGQKKMQKLQHTPGGANLAWPTSRVQHVQAPGVVPIAKTR